LPLRPYTGPVSAVVTVRFRKRVAGASPSQVCFSSQEEQKEIATHSTFSAGIFSDESSAASKMSDLSSRH